MRGRSAASLVRDGVLILAADSAEGTPPVGPAALIAAFETFADAYLKGVRRAMVLEGPGSEIMLNDLHRFNALLASRDLPNMAIRYIAPETRAGHVIQEHFTERTTVRSRRGFLALASHAEAASAKARLAEIQASGSETGKALFAAVPVIDPHGCNGCDACLQICPSDVVTQIKDKGGADCYRIAPGACDACGLCQSICTESAITLETMARANTDIPLTAWNCRSCGVLVHVPSVRANGSSDCDICRQTGQNKNLFQVLS